MGIAMGRGGFDVKDLHNQKHLLELPVGELCISGQPCSTCVRVSLKLADVCLLDAALDVRP